MSRRAGFTLIELVIALMIVVALVSIAIPAIDGLGDERAARKPIEALAGMVQDVRKRAMIEQEAYQIVFDADGFYALRYFHPYRKRDDFKQLLMEMESTQQDGGLATNKVERAGASATRLQGSGPEPVSGNQPSVLSEIGDGRPVAQKVHRRDRYLKKFGKPVDLDVWVMFWGDPKWNKAENDYFRRWVFQPTGVCNPVQVRVESGDGFFEVKFDPLTGEIQKEKYFVPALGD